MFRLIAFLFLAAGVVSISGCGLDPESRDDKARKVAFVRALADRGTGDALLVAAAAAQREEDPEFGVGVPDDLASATLLARATARAGEDAKVWYAAALYPCASPCIADAARARLKTLEPQNAAVWMLEFQHAAERGQTGQARAALAAAAKAPEYRDYEDALFRTVLQQSLAKGIPSPVRPDTSATTAEHDRRFAADFLGTMAYFQQRPARYRWFPWTCESAALHGDAEVVRDCVTVARRMDVDTSGQQSLQAARILLSRLVTDPAERPVLVQRRRELIWLMLEGHPGKYVEATSFDAPRDAEIDRALAGMGLLERHRRQVAERGLTFPPDFDDGVSDDLPPAIRLRCPPPLVADAGTAATPVSGACAKH